MKYLSTLGLLFLTFWSVAQNYMIEIDSSVGKYRIQDVIKFDSLSAEELFIHTQSFLPKAFVNAKIATQSADKEAGQIVIKTSLNLGLGAFGDKVMHFILTFQFKEGRVRYTFSDFVYEIKQMGETPFENKIVGKRKIKEQTEEEIKRFVMSYIAHISESKKNDDW